MKKQLRLPLVNEITMKFPPASKVLGAEMQNDICRITVYIPDKYLEPDGRLRGGVASATVEHKFQILLVGEKRKYKVEGGENDGKEIEMEVPIPESTAERIRLGIFETKETPGTFHVFYVPPIATK